MWEVPWDAEGSDQSNLTELIDNKEELSQKTCRPALKLLFSRVKAELQGVQFGHGFLAAGLIKAVMGRR